MKDSVSIFSTSTPDGLFESCTKNFDSLSKVLHSDCPNSGAYPLFSFFSDYLLSPLSLFYLLSFFILIVHLPYLFRFTHLPSTLSFLHFTTYSDSYHFPLLLRFPRYSNGKGVPDPVRVPINNLLFSRLGPK